MPPSPLWGACVASVRRPSPAVCGPPPADRHERKTNARPCSMLNSLAEEALRMRELSPVKAWCGGELHSLLRDRHAPCSVRPSRSREGDRGFGNAAASYTVAWRLIRGTRLCEAEVAVPIGAVDDRGTPARAGASASESHHCCVVLVAPRLMSRAALAGLAALVPVAAVLVLAWAWAAVPCATIVRREDGSGVV